MSSARGRTRVPVRSAAALAAVVVAGGALTACGSGSDDSGDGTLTVWSMENQSDRVAAAQRIADQFTAQSGVKVKIVGLDEDQFSQLVTSAAAAGNLPDVVGGLSLTGVNEMAVNDLVDTDAAAAVVKTLGAGTFSARALQMDVSGGKQLAVPSDGWPQMLAYRKDLFAKAGLPAPDTFDKIRQAAQKLNSPNVAGISIATDPGDAFTQQTFEDFALGNGCQLVDQSGKVTLESPACVNTFSFYNDLVHNYSVPGAQNVDSTRATYFAGKAAMTVWSSYLLPQLAGLQKDAAPSCPQCQADPEFLAKNTGFVTAIKGPDGSAAQNFGELGSWVITQGDRSANAQKFVSYMLDQGYAGWLGLAPQGKIPARTGTTAEAGKFTKAWAGLQVGTDTKKPLSAVYPADVIQSLQSSLDSFQQWGIPQGQGGLAGASLAELPVPKAVSAMTGGTVDPAGAAKQASAAVQDIQKTLK
ncbi:extracellular solute-binding protein [Amycolatopsis sp. NPDC049253]|uniref:ABC transporter substrate-binding protein n=1 Tax=Amycolatopsis sp. NPDC049253 TaxID=3155274 RepID=UPI0034420747